MTKTKWNLSQRTIAKSKLEIKMNTVSKLPDALETCLMKMPKQNKTRTFRTCSTVTEKGVTRMRMDFFLILSCRLSSLSQARLLSGRQALWVQNNTASPNMQLWVKDPLAVYCLHISMPKGWKSQGHHRHRYLMLAATTEGTMTPLCYKGMWQGTALSCVQDDSNLTPPFVSAYSSRIFFSGSLKDKRMSFWAAQSFCRFLFTAVVLEYMSLSRFIEKQLSSLF